MSRRVRYAVYRSAGGGKPGPDLLTDATRRRAEQHAREVSATDPAGGTYVVEREDTWRWVSCYRRGELIRRRAGGC